MDTYKITVFWSERDKLFVAECPEFEGLAVVGKTRAKAIKEAEAAIKDYLEIYKEDGIPIPQPSTAPEYSGQVRLRMSNYVHRKAVEMADAEGVSLNTYLIGAIESRNAVLQFHRELVDRWNAAFTNIAQSMVSVQTEVNLTSNNVNVFTILGGAIPLSLNTAPVEKVLR